MNLEAVRAFVTVAEEGQFQLAADHLAISQQAVSKRLAALEADLGVRLAALSVDDKEAAAEMTAKNKLTFPVGYGADAHAVAELTGAFVNPDPVYPQSTGFVLDPAGNVTVRLWDHVTALAGFPGFAELKRSLRERPQLRSFGVDPGEAGAEEDWRAGSRKTTP